MINEDDTKKTITARKTVVVNGVAKTYVERGDGHWMEVKTEQQEDDNKE
jgi:hypothetical protein